jgi:hypothetical protein
MIELPQTVYRFVNRKADGLGAVSGRESDPLSGQPLGPATDWSN